MTFKIVKSFVTSGIDAILQNIFSEYNYIYNPWMAPINYALWVIIVEVMSKLNYV